MFMQMKYVFWLNGFDTVFCLVLIDMKIL